MVEVLRRPNTSASIDLEPHTEEEKNRNIELVNAFGMLLNITSKYVMQKHFASILFENPKNSLDEISISLTDNKMEGHSESIPEGFTMPVFTYGACNYGRAIKDYIKQEAMTYPQYFLAPDDNIYFLRKIYLFDKEGRAIRHEYPTPTFDHPTDKIKKRLPKIDFVPSETDGHYSRLNMEDYGGIVNGLVKIKDFKVRVVYGQQSHSR